MHDRYDHSMPWGAQWQGGTARFQLWAPAAQSVDVHIESSGANSVDAISPASADSDEANQANESAREVAMWPSAGGHWTVAIQCPPGTRYRYKIKLKDGRQLLVADPASRSQDGDVDDASVVLDPCDYAWQHPQWPGRPWHEAIIYELHVGALGGFAGVTEKLASLAKLGVTAIELMPVADFPGPHNWGYDGVLPFAPDAAYGTPTELKRLIDTAHGLGLMVFLDVVYNHFGPDGNYLADYAPEFFHDSATTAWGGAVNFQQPEVRAFFTDNALYWLIEYRFDGLRLDAVHAIKEQDWLPEMAQIVQATVRGIDAGRQVHLVLENDGNSAHLLKAGFNAQWNDDAHHVMHVLLTGEHDGYYSDYAHAPAERLARCLAEGFVYQGEASPYRGGELRGEPSADLPPTAFVLFLQNHDQIGNRALGDRLSTLAHPAALRVAQALLLLAPPIPLLFMGEESASTQPFLYFTSHRSPELAEAVRKGRLQEFAATAAFSDAALQTKMAVPNDESTFTRSVPAAIGEQGDPATTWVRDLLTLRHQHIMPHLPDCRSLGAEALGHAAVLARWQLGPFVLSLVLNLAAEEVTGLHAGSLAIPSARAQTIFDSGGVRHGLATGQLQGHGFLALLEAP